MKCARACDMVKLQNEAERAKARSAFYVRRQSMASTGPDCATCWKRGSCAMARDGGFCTAWQSREPQPRGQDWAEAWSRGEEE